MEIRQAISMYLTAKAYNDTEFKNKFENPDKNLDECVLYIQYKMLEKVTEEQKKGGAACVIPSDDEIFALAEQYYMDDDIKIDGKRIETIEVNLTDYRLVQSRGLQNESTRYHKRIVNLVNANMEEIRKRNINHKKMKIAV